MKECLLQRERTKASSLERTGPEAGEWPATAAPPHASKERNGECPPDPGISASSPRDWLSRRSMSSLGVRGPGAVAAGRKGEGLDDMLRTRQEGKGGRGGGRTKGEK